MILKRLIIIWKTLQKPNSFIQNFAFVFSGKTFNFLIGMAIVPILARLYSPATYGLYGLYYVFVANLSIVVSLRIPAAIIVTENEKELKSLLKSISTLVIIMIVFCSGVFILFDDWIYSVFNAEKLKNHGALVILGVFFTTLAGTLGNWNVRSKIFKKSTFISVGESVAIKATNLCLGLIGLPSGLIWGDIIGKSVAIFLQFVLFIRRKWDYLVPEIRFRVFVSVFKKYKEYPYFIFPSAWMVVFTSNLIVLFISNQYSIEMVGSFTMASSILFLPVNLVANASQPLIMQKAVESKENVSSLKENISRFIKVVLYAGSIIVFAIFMLIESIINIFLGIGWQDTALIIQILSPMLVFQTLFIVTTGLLLGMSLNRSMLLVQSVRASWILVTIGLMFFLDWSFVGELMIYSGLSTVMLIGLCIFILKVSGLLDLRTYFWAFLTYILSVAIGLTFFRIW